jgi:hypothetical protein
MNPVGFPSDQGRHLAVQIPSVLATRDAVYEAGMGSCMKFDLIGCNPNAILKFQWTRIISHAGVARRTHTSM